MMLPGIGFTSASWRAYWIQNGVMKPITSPGSSHAGATVTYSAQRISPSGLACASARSARAAPSAAHTSRTVTATANVRARVRVMSKVGSSVRSETLDDGILPQDADFFGGVAQLAEDLVGVLAVDGRGAADRPRRAGERRWQPLHQHLAALGMTHGLRELVVLHLGILEHLLDVVDRPGGHAGPVEDLDPLGARLLHDDAIELGVHLLAVLRSVAERLEPRIVDQLGRADRGAEPPVHGLSGRGDVDVAIGRREDTGRDPGRVIVAGLRRDLAVHEPARRLEVEHRHHRLEERGVDPLALAGPLALEQRNQDALGQEEPGREIGHRDADPHGALTGQPGDRHEPAHALGDLVVARPLGVRAGLAEAGDRAVDDPRIDLRQRLVVDAEPLLHVRPEVLDDDVGARRQLLDDLDAARMLEVERHRALVPVQVEEVEAERGRVALELLARFDLDYVRPSVRELADGGRARAGAREVDDREPFAR